MPLRERDPAPGDAVAGPGGLARALSDGDAELPPAPRGSPPEFYQGPGELLHRWQALTAGADFGARLKAGQPAVVIIEGDRGSGKSALLAAMAAGCGAAVELRARCHAAERGFSFGMVSQLLERLPGAEPEAPTGPSEAPAEEYRLLDRWYRAVRALAAREPVVLAVDDMHLVDALSARWVSYLARRLDDLPIGLLVTVNGGGAGRTDPAAAQLIADLSALKFARVVRPEPLCADCASALIARRLGRPVDPGLARRFHGLTRGNPYVLTLAASELAVTADADPVAALGIAATALARAAMGWLRQDDPVKARVAEQFAIGGSDTLETAAMLVGQGEEVARAARGAFRGIGLLAPAAPDRFAHPEIGGAIGSTVQPQDRAEMHAHAARMLSQIGESAMLAAEHAMLAGAIGEPWVRAVLQQAARQAAAAGDWLRGARYLNRSLLEPGPPRQTLAITAELGALEFHRDIDACLRQVDAAAALAAAYPGTDAVLAVAADAALAVEDGDAAAVFSRAAVTLSAEESPERGALLRLAASALLCGHPHEPDQTASIRQAMRSLACGPQDMAARQLLSALALSAAGRGRGAARCKALALRAAENGRVWFTDPVHSTVAGAALALAWAGELDAASETSAQALEAGQRMASPTGEGLALFVRSVIAFQRGNLTAALNDAHQALHLFHAVGASSLEAAAAAALTRVQLLRGETGIIPAEVTSPASRASAHPFILASQQEVQAMVAAAGANHALALRLYLESGRQLMAAGVVNPACSAWRSQAVLQLVALGRAWDARTLAASEITLARSWGAPGPLGRALVAAAAAHDGTARRDLLTEAVSVLEDSGCRLQLARALIALGREMHADSAQHGRTASVVLERGLNLAQACGAVALAETAQQAMHANGTRPRGHLVSTELTTAERRVAELIVTGMSNQDVADHLTLSKRTIDTHLGRIYRKLGITGRTRLGDAISSPPTPSTDV